MSDWDVFHSSSIRIQVLSFFFCFKPEEISGDSDVFRLSLIFLNGNDLINSSFDVEPFDNLSELSCLQLSVSQDVFNVQK